MKYQKVLQNWKECKDKLIKEQKFLKFLATKSFEETVLSMFPLGIDSCRQKLNFWNSSDYQVKLSQHKSDFIERQNKFGETSEHLSLLAMVYIDKIDMFNDLVKGWKKEKDSYARYRDNNNPNSGPTIHEVDDW